MRCKAFHLSIPYPKINLHRMHETTTFRKFNASAMKWIYLIFASALLAACNSVYKNHTFQRNWTSRIHEYENGKKILMQIDKYRNSSLAESKIFYQRWPNGELKLISKKGFYLLKDDVYFTSLDPALIPDGIIVHYFDTNYAPHDNVYKNGKQVPYTLGYPDGYSSWQFRKDKPGVYTWKNGVEYFEREFTEKEWGSHRRLEQELNEKK